MKGITFRLRWREELEAIADDKKLIFECTMGTLHVYFPSKQCWKANTPTWAKEKWDIYLEACSDWCRNNKIPISIVDNAVVYEEAI